MSWLPRPCQDCGRFTFGTRCAACAFPVWRRSQGPPGAPRSILRRFTTRAIVLTARAPHFRSMNEREQRETEMSAAGLLLQTHGFEGRPAANESPVARLPAEVRRALRDGQREHRDRREGADGLDLRHGDHQAWFASAGATGSANSAIVVASPMSLSLMFVVMTPPGTRGAVAIPSCTAFVCRNTHPRCGIRTPPRKGGGHVTPPPGGGVKGRGSVEGRP